MKKAKTMASDSDGRTNGRTNTGQSTSTHESCKACLRRFRIAEPKVSLDLTEFLEQTIEFICAACWEAFRFDEPGE